MTLLQQFLSTVENGLFLSVDHYVWAPARAHGGRPRNGTAEALEGSGHVRRKPSFPGMCSARWALSSLVLAVMVFLARQPRPPPQWPRSSPESGQVWALPPRLQRGHKILKVLVLTEQKVSTRNDCKQEWDFIVWLRLKCYFVCILYSRKKLVCNNKATLCLLWGGRELKRDGQG